MLFSLSLHYVKQRADSSAANTGPTCKRWRQERRGKHRYLVAWQRSFLGGRHFGSFVYSILYPHGSDSWAVVSKTARLNLLIHFPR